MKWKDNQRFLKCFSIPRSFKDLWKGKLAFKAKGRFSSFRLFSDELTIVDSKGFVFVIIVKQFMRDHETLDRWQGRSSGSLKNTCFFQKNPIVKNDLSCLWWHIALQTSVYSGNSMVRPRWKSIFIFIWWKRILMNVQWKCVSKPESRFEFFEFDGNQS